MRCLRFSSSNCNRKRHDNEHNRLFGKISRPLISPSDENSTSTFASKSFGNDIDDDSIEELSTLRSFNEVNEPLEREKERLRAWSRPRPQPLPLPKFDCRRKECPCGGLPSPDDGSDRCSPCASPPPPPVNRAYAHQETAQDGNANPSNIVRQDPNGIGDSRDSCNVEVPVRSAPTSPYSSPVCSPPSIYYSEEPRGKQVWSAPEMPFDDKVLKITNLSHLEYTSYNSDCTPLHSPAARSTPRNTPSTATSPVHPNISSETLLSQHENVSHFNVHPLPLPPGATSSTASLATSQAMTRVDSLPMTCQWQKGKLIGCGTFGSVYVATNRKTGALCAMKEVEMFPDDPKSAECIKQLQQEIKVLSQLRDPNIVRYYGSEITDDRFYIYVEYVHPGSIDRYVRENCGAITESVVGCFTRHILRGLAYLHSKKTIHRDIKGANLLVDSCGVVKLADFGMAKLLTGQRSDLSLKGSPYWMAPELMQAVMQKDNSSVLALAVDIWSLGCTIIEMFTGKPPWSEYEGAAAMFKVMKDTPPMPSTLSPEGKDFLQLCFCRNPAARPSAAKLLDHQFLRG